MTLSGSVVYCQMKWKLRSLAKNTLGVFGVHRRMTILKIIPCLMRIMVEGLCYCGAILIPKGLGNLIKVHGIINTKKNLNIFKGNQTISAKALKVGHDWIIHQVNEPKQMSRSKQIWFTEHKIKLQTLPLQSADLNSIEKQWGKSKRRMHKCGPRNLDDLGRFCKDEWS